MVDNYKELDIWQKGMNICEFVYQVTSGFPKHELYGLTSQMRRCSVSIPSNIAEGFGRRHSAEFKRFLSIAKGSLVELETQIELATRVGYLEESKRDEILDMTNHLGKMLTRFNQNLV